MPSGHPGGTNNAPAPAPGGSSPLLGSSARSSIDMDTAISLGMEEPQGSGGGPGTEGGSPAGWSGLSTAASLSIGLGASPEGGSPRAVMEFGLGAPLVAVPGPGCRSASPPRSRRGSHDGGSPTWVPAWSPLHEQGRRRRPARSMDGGAAEAAGYGPWGPGGGSSDEDERGGGGYPTLDQLVWKRLGGMGHRLGGAAGGGYDLESGRGPRRPLLLSGQQSLDEQVAAALEGGVCAGAAAGPAGGGSTLADQLRMAPKRTRRKWGARTATSLRIAWEHGRYGFEEIPEWLRDNSLITSGYRGQASGVLTSGYRGQMLPAAALRSLFQLHNETFNTWSHLVGFLVTAAMLMVIALESAPAVPSTAPASPGSDAPSDETSGPQPKWPMYMSLVTAMYLYLVSSSAHLLHVISKATNDLLWRLDHTAIAVGCAGAFFPICAHAFACMPDVYNAYISVTCVLCAAVICVSMVPAFHMPKYRPARTAVQLSFGLWGQVPLMHASALLLRHPAALSALLLVYAALGTMVLAAVIFACRVTDRLFPGKVNLFGSSHNILHALVVVANLLFIAGARELWLWRSGPEGVC